MNLKNNFVLLFPIFLLSLVDVASSRCTQVPNSEMLEYSCEGGSALDLGEIPSTAEKIKITNMPLYKITRDTFSRFGDNLWVLSCSSCRIQNIEPDAFRSLTNLQQLSLDSNDLRVVRSSWFRGLDYLTYLDLNYNNIEDIEDEVFESLPALVDLRLSGNKLTCLNIHSMSRLTELKRIFLKENSNFACPNAVSKFLEDNGVVFEPDPEWEKLPRDLVSPDAGRSPSLASQSSTRMPTTARARIAETPYHQERRLPTTTTESWRNPYEVEPSVPPERFPMETTSSRVTEEAPGGRFPQEDWNKDLIVTESDIADPNLFMQRLTSTLNPDYPGNLASEDDYDYEDREPMVPPVSPPREMIPAVSPDDFSMQPPYYEPKINRPIGNYRQKENESTPVATVTTTSSTDKPLPECSGCFETRNNVLINLLCLFAIYRFFLQNFFHFS